MVRIFALLLLFPLFCAGPGSVVHSVGRVVPAAEENGSDEETREAVRKGLNWLARHQDRSGAWQAKSFYLKCRKGDACGGKGLSLNDAGVTGLAVLAFIYSGVTPESDLHGDTVTSALDFLCSVQSPSDGCLGNRQGTHWIYNHAVAGLALLQACVLFDEPAWRPCAEKALLLVQDTKNEGKAWRYGDPPQDGVAQNDVSVTGWMIHCLVTAGSAGFSTREDDLRDALAFIDAMTDSETGRTGYVEMGSLSAREEDAEERWPFEMSEALTAEAITCRYLIGGRLENMNTQLRAIRRGVRLLKKLPPEWNAFKGSIEYYYWFHGTRAMRLVGGKDWSFWKSAIVPALLGGQETDGCRRGSWDPDHGPWGSNGGRVYSTALCTTMLALCGVTSEEFFRSSLTGRILWPGKNKVFYTDHDEDVLEFHTLKCVRIKDKAPRKIRIRKAREKGIVPCLVCCRKLYSAFQRKEGGGESRTVLWPPDKKVFYLNSDEGQPLYYHDARRKPRCTALHPKFSARRKLNVKEARRKGILPCPECCADQYMLLSR
jgi:hypothetical protein